MAPKAEPHASAPAPEAKPEAKAQTSPAEAKAFAAKDGEGHDAEPTPVTPTILPSASGSGVNAAQALKKDNEEGLAAEAGATAEEDAAKAREEAKEKAAKGLEEKEANAPSRGSPISLSLVELDGTSHAFDFIEPVTGRELRRQAKTRLGRWVQKLVRNDGNSILDDDLLDSSIGDVTLILGYTWTYGKSREATFHDDSTAQVSFKGTPGRVLLGGEPIRGGVHELSVQVITDGAGIFCIGLLPYYADLDDGFLGFVTDGAVGWMSASLRFKLEGKLRERKDVPRIKRGDFLTVKYDADSSELALSNDTSGESWSCSIDDVLPRQTGVHFHIAGGMGTSAQLV